MVIGPQFANAAATVHLFVESADGERLTPAEIKFVQVRSMKDYGSAFQDGIAIFLPVNTALKFGNRDFAVTNSASVSLKRR